MRQEGNEQLLQEKWVSVLFLVENKQSWTTGECECEQYFSTEQLFSKCEHSEVTKKQIKSKEWLSPNSDALKVLQDIITLKTVLNDLKRNSPTLNNKWALKSLHFSYIEMVMRSQLAVLDFNSGSGLEQARTKTTEKNKMLFLQKLQRHGHQSQLRQRKIIPIYKK